MVYYNEIDTKAAAWLVELMAAGVIPAGVVDTRSIADVRATELVGFRQCHFFAGIGGWPYALRLAGWPDDRPVWTGSCPCQPFSAAGKGRGTSDPRHLWPEFRRLIAERKPTEVIGEQVASKAGRLWLAGVRADLEELGYAVGAADLCAACIGAPHIRQRLFWVAQSDREPGPQQDGGSLEPEQSAPRRDNAARHRVHAGGVGDAVGDGQPQGVAGVGEGEDGAAPSGGSRDGRGGLPEGSGPQGGVGDASSQGLSQRERDERVQRQATQPDKRQAVERTGGGVGDAATDRQRGSRGAEQSEPNQSDHGSIHAAWSHAQYIPCADGKARRIEPGTSALVDGLPKGMVRGRDPGAPVVTASAEARVMRLKGYGNAIVPQVAAEFIGAYIDTTNGGKTNGPRTVQDVHV